IFYLIQRLQVRILLIVDVNDVETVTALHQIAGAAFRERERRFFKFGNRAAFANPAQRTAILGAARIFGILLGEFRKISASLYLLKDVFRFLAGFFRALGIYFSIGAWKWRLDQNMPDVYLSSATELIAMLIVVGLQVIRGDLSMSLYLGGFEHDVARLGVIRYLVIVCLLDTIVV